jgi:CRISPR-associated protein Cmr4
MDAKLFLLHALSPLHAGTGRGVGMIDLPIAREKATGLPYIPGSSLKGVLRDACEDETTRTKVFGPDTDNAELHAGAINVSDLRILLFPVRSLRGTFAWVTSPLLLRRLKRDADAANFTGFENLETDELTETACYVSSKDCKITNENKQVILEDLELSADTDKKDSIDKWASALGKYLFADDTYWQDTLKARFCIVADDTMSFLLETGTEVAARIALKEETKTVKDGALWYEESLPAESILSGIVAAVGVKASEATTNDVFETIKTISQNTLQVGGNATIGRGLCQMHLIEEA